MLLAALLLIGGCASAPIDEPTTPAQGAAAARFQQLVDDLAHPRMEGRGVGTEGLARARDYLVARFEAIGLEPAVRGEAGGAGGARFTQSFIFEPDDAAGGHRPAASALEPTPVDNVVGQVAGTGALARQVVVIAAHYDHLGFGGGPARTEGGGGASAEAAPAAREPDHTSAGHGRTPAAPDPVNAPRRGALHPGADDNASGVAGLLLAARHYQRFVRANPDTPRRTVLFVAFTAEEWGMHGARHMIEHPEALRVSLDRTVAMLNLDMIGRLHRTLYALGTDSGTAWEALIERAAAALAAEEGGLAARLRIEPRGAVTGLGDHAVFYGELGVPVLHLFTGMHADYHQPSDTAERINAVGGALVARFAAALLVDLATASEPMAHEPTRVRSRMPANVETR